MEVMMSEENGNNGTPEEKAFQIVQETIDNIKKEAKRYNDRSKNFKFLHEFFVFTTIFLGVLAPAFVAMSPRIGYEWFPIVDGGATDLVAIAANLRNVFQWGERFTNAGLVGLELQQLASSTQLKFVRMEKATNTESICLELLRLNDESLVKMYEIITKYFENEATIISKQVARISQIEDPQTGETPNTDQRSLLNN